MSIHIPFEDLTKTQKLLAYVQTRQPILNAKAIFSDETRNYRIPVEPSEYETVKVKIRTARDNVETIFLCHGSIREEMKKHSSDSLFDYYIGTIDLRHEEIEYFFELNLGNLKCYYNKKGITREPDKEYNYKLIPGFKTPDWAKGAVMYQIFVDRFYNGDKENDVVDNEYFYVGKLARKIESWSQVPAPDSVRDFYGGDLQGVIDKIDYLYELGVDVIYLNPIFVSPSNHKYDIQDYDYVDPHFGKIVNDGGQPLKEGQIENKLAEKYIIRTTDIANLEASNDLLIELVQKAHNRGMKVILDGVFNHCGSYNKWLDREKIYDTREEYHKGAYVSKDSPYSTFFHFYNDQTWPDNPNYDGWWGYETLPKLNYERSPKLYKYILDIAKKWISPPFNVDGWRLDVAADLGYSEEFNHEFWREFRKEVKSVREDVIILAEHYGDSGDWLQGDQWDTIMNYDAFMEPITWFLTGLEKHSDEFREDLLGNAKAFFEGMKHNMSKLHIQSQQIAMNELSNHDHSRFLTRTNHKVGRVNTVGPDEACRGINKGIMKEAITIQMTWPGAPTIYYGDEVGVCGWTDPDNRRTFPWGNEDRDLLQTTRALIKIHKKFDAIKTGSIKFLYEEYMVISYGRWDEKDKIVVVVNNANENKSVKIPVWEIGILDSDTMCRLILTTQVGYTTEEETYKVQNGKLNVNLPKFSSMIIRKN